MFLERKLLKANNQLIFYKYSCTVFVNTNKEKHNLICLCHFLLSLYLLILYCSEFWRLPPLLNSIPRRLPPFILRVANNSSYLSLLLNWYQSQNISSTLSFQINTSFSFMVVRCLLKFLTKKKCS